MADPSDCAPDAPNVKKDLEEILELPDDHPKFSGEPMERMTEPLPEIDDEEYLKLLEGESRGEKFSSGEDTAGGLGRLARRWRVPMEVYKDMERQMKVPFYRWWRLIEDGRTDVELALGKVTPQLRKLGQTFKKQEREEIQHLFETKLSGEGYDELLNAASHRVKTGAEQLEGMYRTYFEDEGWSAAETDELFKAFPQMRKFDGDYKAYRGAMGGVPKPVTRLSRQFATGELSISAREMDFWPIARRLTRAVAHEKHLTPNWKVVRSQFQAYLDPKASAGIPYDVAEQFNRYIHEVLHQPDGWQTALGRSMQAGIQRMTASPIWNKYAGKKLLSDLETFDLAGQISGWNYYANMAWNTGMVLRNYLQTLQTTVPKVGLGDAMDGIRYGLKWMNGDKHIAEEMTQLGVITRDIGGEQFQEMQRVLDSLSTEGSFGKAREWYRSNVLEKGTQWYKMADDFNRIVAYKSMRQGVERYGEDFLRGKLTWEQFREKSKMDFLDHGEGPLTQMLKGTAQRGDIELLAHMAGTEFHRQSQFLYSRGNVPFVMQSTWGRLLGQYGTWPAYFSEYMRNMAVRGSAKNRMQAAAKWLTVNAGMAYGANQIFGVDLSRSLFLSPFGYRGGPLWEVGQQVGAALSRVTEPDNQDPVTRIQALRLKGAILQIAPIPSNMLRNAFRGMDAISEAEYADAMKLWLGLPPADKRYDASQGASKLIGR